MRLSAALAPYWEVRSSLTEAAARLDAVLPFIGVAPILARALLLHGAGRIAWRRSAYDSAIAAFESSRALIRGPR